MDAKEYIESGILEAYALGMLSPEEAKEVEQRAAENSEVKQALQSAQNALENLATGYATSPPPEWKAEILKNALGTDSQEEDTVVRSIVPIEKKKTGSSGWAIAATVLLLASLGMNFMQYNSLEEINANLSQTRLRVAQLEQQNTTFTVNYQELKKDFDVVRDPSTATFVMKAVEDRDPAFRADVLWNANSELVYLDVKTLPAVPIGKQYQLWALKGGKPVSMGVFDMTEEGNGLKEVGKIDGADAFAVTLEPAGGSVSPTMEEMYVYGEPLG